MAFINYSSLSPSLSSPAYLLSATEFSVSLLASATCLLGSTILIAIVPGYFSFSFFNWLITELGMSCS
ncbi:hypothetical protein Csa_009850 [Cucumis sativus]|uniref:Uncharacterized protein n=1 Tax=Cucumis sativus TaxID=3659 RepID=A0A0A0L8S7_CUCSA|nr:hypothetical protein Csa_009850 [Cucumis sativus]